MTRQHRAHDTTNGHGQNKKPLLVAVPGRSPNGTLAVKVSGLPHHGGRSQIGVEILTLFQDRPLGGRRLLYDHVHQDSIATTGVGDQRAGLRVETGNVGFLRIHLGTKRMPTRFDCNAITG